MALPGHISIIMDGNGRWATQRGLPRAAGHREGVRTLRGIVEHCVCLGVGTLSVFAFSSENWDRPQDEVGLLLDLFMHALNEQVEALHRHGVSLRFVGDLAGFPASLRQTLHAAEQRTAANTALQLLVAANYGGRWDLVQACRKLAHQARAGGLDPGQIDEELFAANLSLAGVPPPDLFIRTGGEQRISNYLLWDLAYSELYFTEVPWPEFTPAQLDDALQWYASRERRFGGLAGVAGQIRES
ncbi:MAG: di-trans,poly-cis-decaprenylcistransferase [Gammaproteobacteria bacterium RIFCSPLOWO2_02_FULL_61_13]|nr:MAG: di-trans,poly-cis-decaprenylcistransferase [Gammaproteobacteria bacterium RIFCSPLOWO2_02_FULL_61_13]